MNRARPLSSPTLHFPKARVKRENLAKGVLIGVYSYAPQGAGGVRGRIFGSAIAGRSFFGR
jgi:hypothetical protein